MKCEDCQYKYCVDGGKIICTHPLVELLGTCPIKIIEREMGYEM